MRRARFTEDQIIGVLREARRLLKGASPFLVFGRAVGDVVDSATRSPTEIIGAILLPILLHPRALPGSMNKAVGQKLPMSAVFPRHFNKMNDRQLSG